MKDLKSNLTEDTHEVDGAIHYLEGIIRQLKSENKLPKNILHEIEVFYSDTILPYMEYYYINGEEIDDYYTRITVNEILDLANTLNKLF
jgi:hypothetical protein